MEKKNFFLTIFLIFNFTTSLLGQEDNIEASVKMDLFGNLYVNAKLFGLEKNTETIVIDNDILIHSDFAKLIRGIKINSVQLIEYKPVSKKIDYVINLPKGKNSSYLKASDFFLTTINYLPILKSEFSKKKKFDLHFDFPEKFQIIYPDESDLLETYTYVPPIIAGEFIKSTIHDFNVYNLKSYSKSVKRIQDILEVVDNAFSFFQKFYPKIIKKPKIIFLPIKTSDAKTLENAIIFDTKILDEKIPLQKRLIAHEVSHLWWGVGGITFDNNSITEGIAEYLALKYMDNIDEGKYVKTQKNIKLYHIEGNYDFNDVLDKKKNKKNSFVYSYELIPLIFFDMENRGINVFNKLFEFYINHQGTSEIISYQDFFYFLNSEIKYDFSFNFPDFYITEKEEKLFINCSISGKNTIEVEFTNNKNNTYRETLTFDNDISIHQLNPHEFKKIIIDPDYKVLQTSRLNDIWLSNESSIFSKNRYFSVEDSNPIALSYSTKMLDYLFSKNNVNINDLTCEDNLWLIEKIDRLKKSININDDIILTGASTLLKEGDNNLYRIDIKATYYSKGDNSSRFIYFYLYYDKDLKYLQNFKLESELDETEK